MTSKLNWLVTQIPSGALVLQSWLSAHGISRSLVQKYHQSGWLKRLSPGVFYRPAADDTSRPDWIDALVALNEQLQISVHLAGSSSLAHQGLGQYLSFEEGTVWVGAQQKQALPKWFKEFANQHWTISSNSRLTGLEEKDFIHLPIKGRSVKASTAELAAYEIAASVGKHISFEHAAELFQGLVNLSPRRVQSILERSRAIQANRVFLFLANYHQHAWLKHLDESRIELGAGKRQVIVGGRLEGRYQITVPERFAFKVALHAE